MHFFGEPKYDECSAVVIAVLCAMSWHDGVIKWKHFPRYWPSVRGIHRSPVNSPHKGQWRGALMFLWSAPWINGWVNNHESGDLRRHRAHYDVIVMVLIDRIITRLLTTRPPAAPLKIIQPNFEFDWIRVFIHSLTSIRSQTNFAYSKTAQLSCNVQFLWLD